MTPDVRGEAGFTFVELLIAMALMVVVLGATLTTFDAAVRADRHVQDHNETLDIARTAIDHIGRDFRNEAAPTNGLEIAMLKDGPDDVQFVHVGDRKPAGTLNQRNLERVRFCLEAATRTIWVQTQTWTTALPPAAPAVDQACPGDAGWTTRRVLVDRVVNGEQPVWTFVRPPGGALSDITSVRTTVVVDRDVATGPRPTTLATTVKLRNQNRRPRAEFAATSFPERRVLLVAGAADPDGNAVSYRWFIDGRPIAGCTDPSCDFGPDEDPTLVSGVHDFSLEVADSSGLRAEPTTRPVQVLP